MVKIDLNKMYYPQFVSYLKQIGIEFTEKEDVDIDYWGTVYVEVIPSNTKFKHRFFSMDGGHQLFE